MATHRKPKQKPYIEIVFGPHTPLREQHLILGIRKGKRSKWRRT